ISSIRRSMLVNSFSFLPVTMSDDRGIKWKLLSDYSIATYLRGAEGSNERNRRLARKLGEVVDQGGIGLIDAPTCSPDDPVKLVLDRSQGQPVLVIGSNGELWGIITPFDVL